jgi:biopolymer transport protein ExbD
MATIIDTAVTTGRRAGVRRMKKHSLKTDMTPMVDLGFLLIAFFVMTTEITRPRVTNLNMPKEGGPPILLKMSNALTVLVDAEKVFYYHGDWKEALAENQIFETNLSVKDGLGKVIREKQAWLQNNNSNPDGKDGLMLLIKPTANASYQAVIDALDETLINNVTRHAMVKLEAEELEYVRTHIK